MELPNSAWTTAFILAFVVFACALIFAFLINRRPRINSVVRPFPIIIAGTYITALIMAYPVYLVRIGSDGGNMVDAFLMAIQAGFHIFASFSPNEIFFNTLDEVDSWIIAPYLSFNVFLNLFAPILLFSFILSFIKGLKAFLSYLLGYHREVFIFSKLNEKSLVLAKSVEAHYINNKATSRSQEGLFSRERPLIVFTDVNVEQNEPPQSLYQSAVDAKFICMKKSIISVRFDIHSKKAPMNFIIIGDDRNENNRQALRLFESTQTGVLPDGSSSSLNKTISKERLSYASRRSENTCLYLFDSSKESELLLDGKQGAMTVRRINRTRQFVHNFLWDYLWNVKTKEHVLFSSALEAEGRKLISVLLVGLGKTGSTLLKALSWFGQMDGYELKIHALDIKPNIEKKLRFECPELLDDLHNHNTDPNEVICSITIHSGVDVQNEDFSDLIESIAGDTSLAFVSLGDDELNVETAVNLRILLKRAGREEPDKPIIYAVVHDSERASFLGKLSNYSDDDYCIDLVGDNQDMLSYQMVFDPRLEDLVAQRHIERRLPAEEERNLRSIADKVREEKKLTPEESREAEKLKEKVREIRTGVWSKEYNRNSSIARIMHERVVDVYGPSSDDEIALLESRRWNAYMRSEGFVYSEKRDNLAKQHHMLIPYDKKPQDEQAKDYRDLTR